MLLSFKLKPFLLCIIYAIKRLFFSLYHFDASRTATVAHSFSGHKRAQLAFDVILEWNVVRDLNKLRTICLTCILLYLLIQELLSTRE